ncbi:hypothetical protein AB0P21_40960 [Kribbella sp. NPDC056861]|uniref:hypothetical protein n=1 Tax=Kribbella sp. NPDC056861 TaxID=3154857 RepID=UPI003436B4FD
MSVRLLAATLTTAVLVALTPGVAMSASAADPPRREIYRDDADCVRHPANYIRIFSLDQQAPLCFRPRPGQPGPWGIGDLHIYRVYRVENQLWGQSLAKSKYQRSCKFARQFTQCSWSVNPDRTTTINEILIDRA